MPKKVPISARALVQRVQRALAPDKTIRQLRGIAAKKQGPFVEIDIKGARVLRDHLELSDVEALARELGVVQAWEEVASS